MTELDEAMQQHMAYIVYHENTPFCANDFLFFECDGKEYKPDYGTIRNKFAQFTKKGIIERDYRTNMTYYTLKGKPFGKKSMTVYHTGGKLGISISPNHPLYKILQNQVYDKQSIHNIRLRLEVPNIFSRSLCTLQYFDQDEINRDFRLPYQNIDNAQMQIRVHKTDIVSVIIGCSLNPIPLDHNGFNRLYKILGIAQGYLQGLTFNHNLVHIPDCDNWIITMLHFNQDGLKEYTGEKFSITVEKLHHTIERIYTKCFGNGINKTRIRVEIQDYPNKTVKEAIEEKLNVNLVTPYDNVVIDGERV